jgi:hypothetical protein
MLKRRIMIGIPALIALALLSRLALAQTATPTLLPTITAIPAPSATPGPTTFYVTTVQPSTTPGCAAPLPLQVGGLAYVSGGVYVRTDPNGSRPWVNYYAENTVVKITGGPVCDGQLYNWWQVRGPGNDGWVAEGSPGNYFMRFAAPSGDFIPCSPPADLNIGGRARLLLDVKVHDSASENGLVLTVAPSGSLANVLEGPTCAGGVNYWRVSVTVVDVVYTGWAADAKTDGTPLMEDEFARDVPVCAPPLDMAIGSRANVNYKGNSPKSLRAAPSINGELIATLLDGIGFEIIGGPVCAKDGYNWWQIRILSRPDVSGWLAEGGPANYWILPLRDDLNPVPPAPPYQP